MNHPASPASLLDLRSLPNPIERAQRPARAARFALAFGVCLTAREASANDVTEWNTKAAVLVNEQSPMEQSRSFAIVQLAERQLLPWHPSMRSFEGSM